MTFLGGLALTMHCYNDDVDLLSFLCFSFNSSLSINIILSSHKSQFPAVWFEFIVRHFEFHGFKQRSYTWLPGQNRGASSLQK